MRAVASGFGAGFAPFAPGTAGTVVGIPFALALHLLLPPAVHLAVLALLVPVGAFVCGRAAEGDEAADPSWIVFDEMIGYCFTVARAPTTLPAFGVGFLLFRLFDIIKPPPAGWIDRVVPGGWGILLDDVCAGFYAAVVLALLARGGLI